ncbi:MAG: TRAP transporter small permease subunit [Dehalococcoidales bacterium]|nr:TRAP transporter small permease subunit [Dehalococcoidales bacterium]
MSMLRGALKAFDTISEWSAKSVAWFLPCIIAVICYDTFARYLFNSPTIFAYDTSYMLSGALMVGGMAYVTVQERHVRVDVIYNYLSPKVKLIINALLAFLFYLPLAFITVIVSANEAWRAWLAQEYILRNYWNPPAYPLKGWMVLMFTLFFLAGVCWFIRTLALLISGKKI